MSNKKVAFNLTLSFLAAVLIYAAYFLNPFFVWVAFVPLFLLAWYNFFGRALFFSLLVAFLLGVSGSYWVVSYDQKWFYLLALYITSFYFLYATLLGLIFSRFRNYFSFLIPGVLYTFIYWLYSVNGVGEYWFNVSALQPRFSFITSSLGELGLAFLIITVNSLIAFLFIYRKNLSYFAMLIVIVGVLVVANYYATHKIPDGDRVRVAIVQGAFSEDWSWRASHASGEILEKYIELTRQVSVEKPDLVVWPEYSLPINLESESEIYQKISSLARELKVNLIIGAMANDGLKEEGDELLFFDSAYGFDRLGNSIGRYDALRPFNFKTKRSIGEGYWIFNTDVGRIGALICYDEVFDKVANDYDRLGVDFFVTISNNEPVKSPVTKYWLKRFSELRAANYKKYFVRSTNTGYSQVVNPYGVVVKALPDRSTGVATVDIYLEK